MNSKKRIIGVVPVGDVPGLAPKVIAAHIIGYLKLPAEILTPSEPPTAAFDAINCQYNAAKILNCFESGSYDNYDKIVGVFNVDLFIPTFAYVFGEAKLGGKHALVSLFRLTKGKEGRTPPSAILYERAAKVALHELGHLYNLSHVVIVYGSVQEAVFFHLTPKCGSVHTQAASGLLAVPAELLKRGQKRCVFFILRRNIRPGRTQ